MTSMRNGELLIEEILASADTSNSNGWTDSNDDPGYNEQSGWEDENGAYHDDGWNESWSDGGWQNSH